MRRSSVATYRPRPRQPTSPPLFEAIQKELGLRLEATKGPVDALVVDTAERPAEN